MRFDRRARDVKLLGNLGIGEVAADEADDLELGRREAVPATYGAPPLPTLAGRIGARLIKIEVAAFFPQPIRDHSHRSASVIQGSLTGVASGTSAAADVGSLRSYRAPHAQRHIRMPTGCAHGGQPVESVTPAHEIVGKLVEGYGLV